MGIFVNARVARESEVHRANCGTAARRNCTAHRLSSSWTDEDDNRLPLE